MLKDFHVKARQVSRESFSDSPKTSENTHKRSLFPQSRRSLGKNAFRKWDELCYHEKRVVQT
jgi:hypothetical protein